MAAEWATMPDMVEEEGEPEGGTDRLMIQDEIDTMLGFSAGDDKDAPQRHPGHRRFGLVSYERLPMLEIIFDRMVRLLSTSLRNFFTGQCRGHAREHPLGALRRLHQLDLAAGAARGLQGRGMGQFRPHHGRIRADLFGARHDARRQARPAPRRASTGVPSPRSRCSCIRRIIALVLSDAEAAFKPLSPVTFTVDRIESNPRFVSISRPANAAIRVELQLRHGRARRLAAHPPALRHDRADPRTAARELHGREARPRSDLGEPPRDRGLADRCRRRPACCTRPGCRSSA